MRPLVINNEIEELDLDNVESAALICRSDQVLGHGVVNNVKDIICMILKSLTASSLMKSLTKLHSSIQDD